MTLHNLRKKGGGRRRRRKRRRGRIRKRRRRQRKRRNGTDEDGEKKKRKMNIILPVGLWNEMAQFCFCTQGTPPHPDPRNAREILIN